MDISVSVKLKQLRRDRDITQEELAKFLGVSFQTVSKWERGDCYPDITMLPLLAGYFNVTVDDLLGMDKIRDEARIAEAQNRQFEMYTTPGKADDVVVMWREMARDFPHNISVQFHLAQALFQYAVFTKKNESQYEGVEILERIIGSLDGDERHHAISLICNAYAQAGDTQKALDRANSLTSITNCREVVIENILLTANDERAITQLRDDLIRFNMMFRNAIGQLFSWSRSLKNAKDVVSTEQLIALIKKRMQADEIGWIFYPEAAHRDGDWSSAMSYTNLAELYAELGDTEELFDCAEKIVTIAFAAEKALGAIFSGGVGAHVEPDGENRVVIESSPPRTARDVALEWFEEGEYFNTIRDTPRFRAAWERLKTSAE
ncbi:MAG: helix-turn-helix domain-containing protein [Oscillospiraceae bacterium]|jgi:transcriptional regulator with XRE-family HTH domain|nr:helix-turn-helix domain-containing protein [Oscillospiraceae bacterium]